MLIFPRNRKEVSDRAKTDVQAKLPQSNPFLRNSHLGALISGYAGRVFEFYLQLNELVIQMFPDTAEDEFLVRWGEYVNVTRNPASISNGFANLTGILGSTILAGTQLKSRDNRAYVVKSNVTIANNIVGATAVTRSGSTVKMVFPGNHNFATGQEIDVTGLTEPEYNGTFVIVVTDNDELTYEITTLPSTPATGSGFAAADQAVIDVDSVEAGDIVNLDSGEQLILSTPIAGVDDTGFTQFGTISGGTDIEIDEDLRDRIIFRYANPVANFNTAKIIDEVRKVPGVTRVFVDQACSVVKNIVVTSLSVPVAGVAVADVSGAEHDFQDCFSVNITGAGEANYNVSEKRLLIIDEFQFMYAINPLEPVGSATGTINAEAILPPGIVRIFFTRDNDDSIIPSAAEVADVKNQLLGILPGHTDQKDMIVLAPVPLAVDFTISGLLPNTATMQQAISDSLQVFFRENTSVGENVREIAYECAIQNTIDLLTGDKIEAFTLTTPSGDIIVADGELAVLGTVAFI